jgi:hypothetical protein
MGTGFDQGVEVGSSVAGRRTRWVGCGLRTVGVVVVAMALAVVSVSPAAGVAGFGDVGRDRFFTEPVQWMVDNEITTGTSPTCFSPDDPVTRGQAAAFLWRMEGFPEPGSAHPFGDVVKDWQQDPVSWMFDNQITTGTSATTFSPEENLTRGQMAALVFRMAGEPAGAPPHPFGDVVKDWQQDPVSWMAAEGITTGTSPTTFSPDDPVTRGQLATFLWRYRDEPPVVVDEATPPCWSRVAELSGQMNDVTVGGPGLVAVGADVSGAAVWTSIDGVSWSRVPHHGALSGDAVMSSVTVGGPGLVAVGQFVAADDIGAAAVWTSSDGISWTRVPHSDAVFGNAGISSVTVGGPGLVAVGSDYLAGDGGAAAAWTSADGVSWSRVPHDEAVMGGEGNQSMDAVTVGGPGLVAIGGDTVSDHEIDAAVWTSADGLSWSRVPHDAAVFGDAAISGVTVGGPGLVAVGASQLTAAGGDAAVWTSPDGLSWSRVPHDEAVFGGDGSQNMRDVTAAGPGLIAVGLEVSDGPDLEGPDPEGPDFDAAVWTSADGLSWSRVPHNEDFLVGPGSQIMHSVVVGGPGLVAVGEGMGPTSSAALVWAATIHD